MSANSNLNSQLELHHQMALPYKAVFPPLAAVLNQTEAFHYKRQHSNHSPEIPNIVNPCQPHKQILSHINPHAILPIFLCSTSILLNISAAISTVTLTAMNIKLDFRLSPSIQGSERGRIARLVHLNCASLLFVWLSYFAC